jgi:hypothetical protein
MRRPLTRRPLPVLGLSTALLLGGGGGLLAAGTLAGAPAGADTGTTTTTTATSVPDSGAGAATTSLGGFTVKALAEAVTTQYEQPNFPLPATPTLEVDQGYASTSDNFGPSGSALASALYPGQVVANAGPQLSLLVPGVPLPAVPVWPVQAVSTYPSTPNTAATDEPGVNMDAASSADANTATATVGDNAPTAGAVGNPSAGATAPNPGNPLASSSAIIGIGTISGTSTSEASGLTAIASATATDGGISILGGFITIGSVTSTATATSDGTTGKLTGSTVLSNVNIAGTAVTVDADGIHTAGLASTASPVIPTLNALLKELGITVTVTKATDTVQGAAASRTLDGLKISVDLSTLDSAVGQVASLLPASLTSQLPIALPIQQTLSIDLGAVQVSSTASGAFDNSSSDTSGSGSTGDTGSSSAGDLGSLGTSGTPGDLGTSSPGGSGSPSGTSPTSGTPGAGNAGQPTSAITPVFKGIGAGLILLGVLAALAMAYAYRRVDDATEMVGPACADGDTLSERFNDAGATINDTGDFGP